LGCRPCTSWRSATPRPRSAPAQVPQRFNNQRAVRASSGHRDGCRLRGLPTLLYAAMVGLLSPDQTSLHAAVEKPATVDLALLMHSHDHTLTPRACA
jgi:hypothetical protein